jgi:hypothetical protein
MGGGGDPDADPDPDRDPDAPSSSPSTPTSSAGATAGGEDLAPGRHPLLYGQTEQTPIQFDVIKPIGRQYQSAAARRVQSQQRATAKRDKEHHATHYDCPVFPSDMWGDRPSRDTSYDEQSLRTSDRLSFGAGIRICDEPDPTAAQRDQQRRQAQLECSANQQLQDDAFVQQQMREAPAPLASPPSGSRQSLRVSPRQHVRRGA